MNLFTAGASALGAIAAIAAAVIAWLVYRHQQSADSPCAWVSLKRYGADYNIYEGWVHLDPPGNPPRGIEEIRVRSPKGTVICKWVDPDAAWGDRVLYDLARRRVHLCCRVDSLECQILRLRVRTGRWSWIEAACEIGGYSELAKRNARQR